MFQKELQKMEEDIDVPYPERHAVIKEIESDLLAVYEALKKQGLSEEKAQAEALRRFSFRANEQQAMTEAHAPLLQRLWMRIPKKLRTTLETLGGLLPLILAISVIQSEVSMFELMREGGFEGMLVIGVIGLIMLGRELLHMWRTVFLKQHKKTWLQRDTSLVVLGISALLLLGLSLSLMGLYNTMQAVEAHEFDYKLLITGARESMIPLVFSVINGAFVLFAHYGSKSLLGSWGAPLKA